MIDPTIAAVIWGAGFCIHSLLDGLFGPNGGNEDRAIILGLVWPVAWTYLAFAILGLAIRHGHEKFKRWRQS